MPAGMTAGNLLINHQPDQTRGQLPSASSLRLWPLLPPLSDLGKTQKEGSMNALAMNRCVVREQHNRVAVCWRDVGAALPGYA
jgi:hypothetical protein